MIRGYHVVFGAYGFWLPNDPRGAWSDFVRAWELRRFGKASRTLDRFKREQLSSLDEARLAAATQALKYPAVHFNGRQARAIGRGFRRAVTRSGFEIWACSILPEHVHLVVCRHRYRVERVVGQLKGEATKQLVAEGRHPLAEYRRVSGKMPTPWNEHAWKVFLDDEEAIDAAIHYVEQNPIEEGKPAQQWSFVQPFAGLEHGWVGLHT